MESQLTDMGGFKHHLDFKDTANQETYNILWIWSTLQQDLFEQLTPAIVHDVIYKKYANRKARVASANAPEGVEAQRIREQRMVTQRIATRRQEASISKINIY